jgi:predicted transcriptional regulator
MFGKLFGYAAILRSNLMFQSQNMKTAKANVIVLTDRLIDLHVKKMWMQESTIEALLLLLTNAVEFVGKVIDEETVQTLLKKLVALTNTANFKENNENQLSLLMGLQQCASRQDFLQKLLQKLLTVSKVPIIGAAHMEDFVDALFHSTNKFPKVRERE